MAFDITTVFRFKSLKASNHTESTRLNFLTRSFQTCQTYKGAVTFSAQLSTKSHTNMKNLAASYGGQCTQHIVLESLVNLKKIMHLVVRQLCCTNPFNFFFLIIKNFFIGVTLEAANKECKI